jgi:lipooligosaccharide transport system permease protein
VSGSERVIRSFAAAAADDRETAPVKPRRLERSALAGVLLREWIVFLRFWRTRTFSAVVEPTVYLLAFGLGFGRLVSKVGHVPYVQFVGTGTVATAVLFSAVFSGMFDSLYKRRYQRVYDAMLATPVDVEEMVTAEVLFLGVRAGVYGSAPLLVAFAFGLPPRPAMLLVPFIGALTGIGFAALGMFFGALVQTFDAFGYVISGLVTPLFLVAGTFFPVSRLPVWGRDAAQINPLYHCVELVRHTAFGLRAVDLVHLTVLVAFGLVTWRLAVWRTEARLID